MKRGLLTLVLGGLIALMAMPALPAGTVYEFDSAARRERYTALINNLRCLVCQGQSIAESNADLAKDLRAKVSELIQTGRSDDAILDYMTDRYGDFILYRPPVDPRTWLLWFGPFALIVTAAVLMVVAVRRHRGRVGAAPLTRSDHEHAAALLRGEGDDDGGRRE